MLSLNTNISDLILQRTLLNSTFDLNEAVSRMTTGYKINNAKDNAAGYSIIEDLNTRISSMLQVRQNTEDAVSLLGTAEGGLSEIQTLLERLRELTVQASNGTYDSKTRDSMQAEADAIIEEISRIKNSITYDGRNLYEVPNENAVANPAPIATFSTGAVHNDGLSLSFTPTAFTPAPVLSNVDEGAQTPSSTSFSSSSSLEDTEQPLTPTLSQGEGAMARTMMRSATPAATTLDGAVDIGASATQVVVIDGVEYTVKNKLSSVNSLSWTKDTSTGEVTLLGNNFTITSQKNVSHNLIIRGASNTVYGGDLADTIKITDSSSTSNYIYAGAGDDNIITTQRVVYLYIYGEDGDDNIETVGANSGFV